MDCVLYAFGNGHALALREHDAWQLKKRTFCWAIRREIGQLAAEHYNFLTDMKIGMLPSRRDKLKNPF